MPLQGRVALITGGSTETAQAVAVSLSDLGADICITGQQPELLECSATAVRVLGRRCLAFPADTTQASDVDRLVAAALQSFRRLDILVLISAVWGGGPIHTHNIATWDLVMAANLRSNFLLARAVLPILRAQKSGHVIIIASESALEFYEGEGAYGVSMHALRDLGEYIRRENRDYGIRVNCLCPGLALTPQAETGEDEYVTPQDVADWVVHLATANPVVEIASPLLIRSAK
jgi:NAD(P)-dependent dehydrogenase (short-subunit alcohol dehydrogenase family)